MRHWIVACVSIVVTLASSSGMAASFGRTAGRFGVSAAGSAQYSIPLWAPPGPHGIQPQLSLSYDSQSGIGSLGVGWQLAGLGSISRCNKTYAQDSAASPVTLVTSDGYCLNGNRLRLTSGSYGVDGSTYQTELADFSNITAHGAAGQGPAYFSVQRRDGLTYDYGFVDGNGNGANSQSFASGTTTVLTWFLSKVLDRSGNNYVINYTAQSGTAVPATIYWTPVSAGASTYTYSMQFNYSANVPQSSITGYVAGTLMSNTQLLNSIEIFSGSTVLKDYFLGYQVSPLTARKELITLTECADSAQSNCLLPTKVGYQAGSPGLSSTANTVLTSPFNIQSARYDLNGDGYPDIVFKASNGILNVAFGSATGYAAPISTGISASIFVIGNMNGGGQDGILAAGNPDFIYYSWNGTSFTQASTNIFVDTAGSYSLADVDGDGMPDLIDYHGGEQPDQTVTLSIYVNTNTSSGGTVSFNPSQQVLFRQKGLLAVSYDTPDYQAGKLRRFDFNGDGLDDLVVTLFTGTTTYNTYQLISRAGQQSTPNLIASGSADTPPPIYYTNWNDDKCTDFVTVNVLYVSACNGVTAQSYALSGTVVQALDWDGDGRTDLLVANGSTLGVYLSQATGAPTLTTTSVPYSSTCSYLWMDVNADGLDDLGCWSQTTKVLSYYMHNGTSDLATSFADGYGVTASPVYTPLSNSAGTWGPYQKGTSAVFPYQDYDGPLYVVSSFTSSDGIGGTYSKTFQYTGATMNLQGRGFQGFTRILSQDSRTGIRDYHYYSTVFPTAFMTLSDTATQTNATKSIRVVSESVTTQTLDSTANNQRYFPYDASDTVSSYEVGGAEDAVLTATSVTTRNTPDTYGNFGSIATTVTDNDSASPYYTQSWGTSTAYTISANTANWCLNLPTEVDTTNTPPAPTPAITRHVSYSPDYTNCRESQQVVEPSSSTYKVTTAYGFDTFGNINSQTVTGVGMAARTTGMLFGTTGQFPTQVTNALSQASTPNYDPTSGQLLSIKDPNGITTSWQYDAFARRIKETRPDSTSTTWAYNNCATAGCFNSNNRMTILQTRLNGDGTTLRFDKVYLDTFDRTLARSGQLFDGTYDQIESQYDNVGNVHLQGMPCRAGSCTQYWTTNSYDILNRLTQAQRPISATNSNPQTMLYSYQGRATAITDALGKVTTTIKQVTGNLGRTKDNNGYYVNFNRDAFGSVLSAVDSLSNTLQSATYAYGIGALRQTSSDMDMGSWAYTTDALGEVTAYTDAKSQSFSQTFDALSRPLVRTEPDLTTTWTWGAVAAHYDIGDLYSVSSSASAGNYSEVYNHDSKGRVSSKILTVPGAGSNRFDYGFNTNTGLLSTTTYPASYPTTYRLAVSNAYAYGILSNETDASNSSTSWWHMATVNPRGQITAEAVSDSSTDPALHISRGFDAVTGWVSGIYAGAGNGSGTALQNQAYVYDLMGNVTQRQDNNAGLTENFYYDNLYRLYYSTLVTGGNTTTNLQMCYDNSGGSCTENVAGMGNITSRSDVAGGAAWTYDPTHKHQVTQAGSASFTYSYDANGNARTRNGTLLGWTSYNYPDSVGTSTESATFDYGPNRQRWRMVYAGPSGTETTYYASPLFEIVATASGTEYRHYIYGGDKPVLVIGRSTAGAVNNRSLLIDHQSGVSSIINATTGAALVSESFTSFGNRREASTWSGAPTSTERSTMDGVTREGYTFQTVLGSMGLNHMNGRIQDAITGRFLSADPTIPDAANSQSYQRYAYANNNPVSFVDPSGFDTDCDDPKNCKINNAADTPGNSDALEEVTVTGNRSTDTGPTPLPSGLSAPSVNTPALDEITVTADKNKPGPKPILRPISPTLEACLQSVLYCQPQRPMPRTFTKMACNFANSDTPDSNLDQFASLAGIYDDTGRAMGAGGRSLVALGSRVSSFAGPIGTALSATQTAIQVNNGQYMNAAFTTADFLLAAGLSLTGPLGIAADVGINASGGTKAAAMGAASLICRFGG